MFEIFLKCFMPINNGSSLPFCIRGHNYFLSRNEPSKAYIINEHDNSHESNIVQFFILTLQFAIFITTTTTKKTKNQRVCIGMISDKSIVKLKII